MNHKKILRFLLSVFFLSTFCITIKSQTVSRIISLAPSLTEDLYLLNHQSQLVGCTNYCYTAIDDGIEVVASAINANIEKIISLQPELVIATSLTNIETRMILEKAGVYIKYFPLPKSFQEINDQFLELGRLIGKESLAQSIVLKQVSLKDSLMNLIPDVKPYKVFVEIGTKPLFCVIPNTFLDDYITFSGGENIVNDLTNGQVSRESILIRDPDVIVLVTMGNVGNEEKKIWNNYSHLSAVKKNKIFIVDSNIACSPTPTHFTQTLKNFILNIYDLNE